MKVSPESFEPLSSQGFADLEKKAVVGDAIAQYEVGARFAEGIGVKEDAAKGYEWLKKAATSGESRAERRVGEMLMAGRGTTPDAKQGMEWLTKAADAGDAFAQFDLAVFYHEGTGVTRDYGKAFAWFMKLAQRGDATAQRSLGGMYAKGEGVASDLTAAREWWEKAAAQNEPQALFNLALIYLRGEGVEANSRTALSLLLRASVYGDLDAEVMLAKAYAKGVGVPQDMGRAMDLFEAAARAGNAEAQSFAGSLLAAGTAGPPEYQKARTWFARAAAQGWADAQSQLGIFYQQGVGVAKDPVEALKWFHLAADQGLREATARRKEISLFMEPAQTREARRRADEFKPEPSHPVADDDAAAVCSLSDEYRIPVRMLGETNYLVVDTGATFSVLDTTNQGRLGEPLSRGKVETAFQEQEFAVYSCPEMFIGERRFAPLWTLCGSFEKARMAMGEPCDGVLGMLCLKHYVVSLDPDRNRFSLGGTVPEAVKRSALTIPLKKVPSHNGLVIEASVNGVGPLYLELDTGSSGSISLTRRDWQRAFAHGEPRTAQKYAAGVGDQVEQQKVARVQSVCIGTNQYTNLIADQASQVETSSRLGQEFFRRHICTIDLPNQVLYLMAGEHFRDPDEQNMSGMHPLRLAGKTVVYSVDKGSPAFEAGIRQDDQIVSINGQYAVALKLKTIGDMLQSRPGARIAVEIKRGETVLQFAFELKRSV